MKKKTSLTQPQKSLETTPPVIRNALLTKIKIIDQTEAASTPPQLANNEKESLEKKRKLNREYIEKALSCLDEDVPIIGNERVKQWREWKDPETGKVRGELKIDFDPKLKKRIRAHLYYINVYLPQKDAVRRALEQREPSLLPPFSEDLVLFFFRDEPDLEALWQAVWKEFLEKRDERRRALLKFLCDAMLWGASGRPKTLTSDEITKITDVYKNELAFCQRFRKEEKKLWRTARERRRHLASLFQLTIEAVEQLESEGQHCPPAEWARQRTAAIMGVPLERVRQAHLKPPSRRV